MKTWNNEPHDVVERHVYLELLARTRADAVVPVLHRLLGHA